MMQSPLRIINIAVDPPVNILIRNSDECKYNEDCKDENFCWNGYCMPRGNPGDSCLSDDQCSSGLMCSNQTGSNDGICISHLTEKNIKNVSDKSGMNWIPKDQVIKTNAKMEKKLETIFTHKDEGDIKNRTSSELTSNFMDGTMIVGKSNMTEYLLPITGINTFGGMMGEFSSLSITTDGTLNTIKAPSSPETEITTEGTLSTFPSFSAAEITTEDSLSMSLSSPETEITTDNTLLTFPSIEITAQNSLSRVTEIITDNASATKSSSSPMSEDSIEDAVMGPSSFSTENSGEGKTTVKFAFTATIGKSNISEAEKDIPTVPSNQSDVTNMNTVDSHRGILFEVENNSKSYSEIADMISSYSSHPSNDSSTTALNTTDISTYLLPQPQYWCDDGWKLFRGRCYIQMNDGNYTYHEAKKKCMNMGALLVAIVNEDVTGFLYCNFSANFYFKHPFWIGLSNDGKGWKWSDGTKLKYQLWGKNEPNTIYSCVFAETEKNGRNWYTANCDDTILHDSVIGCVCQQ
ncbi:unnamed protein product [Brugia pahangi]|uniref:C-type lectin domain-containing protein n=1 Tax=Brugia pahangi TaxID=6280 RepID=A0A0N4TKS5_BRUPA|nr:unnamed protein product [Brugia pahangi]